MSISLRLLSVVIVGLLVTYGTVAYAAGISGTGGTVGAGSGNVTAPDIKINSIDWSLDLGDPTLLDKVTFMIQRDTGSGTIQIDAYLVLRNSGGGILFTEVGNAAPDGTAIPLVFTFFDDGVAIADIASYDLITCQDNSFGDKICQ